VFLKIPYFRTHAPLEELVAYDPSVIVGVLGGSSGSTLRRPFKLLGGTRKNTGGPGGVVFGGGKIKDAEGPAGRFIGFFCGRIVDGEISFSPEEAVRGVIHGELQAKRIPPRRSLADDLKLTPGNLKLRAETYKKL